MPHSVRASPMMLASFASLGARALIGSSRRPARCCKRALACKTGINTLAPYWTSFQVITDGRGLLLISIRRHAVPQRAGLSFTRKNLLRRTHHLSSVGSFVHKRGGTHSLPLHVLR